MAKRKPVRKKIVTKNKYRKKRRKNNGINWKLIIAVVVTIIVLLLSYKVYTNLKGYSVVRLESNIDENILAEEEDIQRLLVIIEDIDESNNEKILYTYLLIHNSVNSEVLAIALPGWVYQDGYLLSRGNSVATYDLRYLNQITGSENAYEETINEFNEIFAIKATDYLWITSEANELLGIYSGLENSEGKEVLQNLLGQITWFNIVLNSDDVIAALNDSYTNLNTVELQDSLSIYSALLEYDDADYLFLGDKDYVTEETLSSGETVDKFVPSAFDEELESHMDALRMRDIEKEQVKVEIYNGTEIGGLATLYNRKISNLGVYVIRADNSPTNYDKNTIYVSNLERYDHTLTAIQSVVEDSVVVEGRPDFLTTGDVVVVLGD